MKLVVVALLCAFSVALAFPKQEGITEGFEIAECHVIIIVLFRFVENHPTLQKVD